MGGILKRALALLLVALLALGGTLILCEIAVRVIDGQPILALSLPPLRPTPLAASRPLGPTLSTTTLPDDVDPAWIDVPPPALPRRPEIPDLGKRSHAARKAGITSLQLFYIWNSRAVDQLACAPGSTFARWPEPLLVFDPPEAIAAPMYRYWPSLILPTGLSTNRFGWRGPDLPLNKPPGTVRLAFVGASTTVGLHNLHFSYPEYVIHWLNLWAERAAPGVHFDGINAGREGINSSGIAAVVRQEVIPAEADLVLYYEGANQSLCTRPAPGDFPPRPPRDPFWLSVERFIRSIKGRWQLAERLTAAALVLETGDGVEPPKPRIDVAHMPDAPPENPDGEDRSPTRKIILDDLTSIHAALQRAGGELAVASFIHLVHDGLRFDLRRKAPIYLHLNSACWPYNYADLQRDYDALNRALQRFATANSLPFIDTAAAFPLDSDLFFDAVHLNEDGTRRHAWIVFQALLPLVRERLASGAWPRPDQWPQQEHPCLTPAREYVVSCQPAAPRKQVRVPATTF